MRKTKGLLVGLLLLSSVAMYAFGGVTAHAVLASTGNGDRPALRGFLTLDGDDDYAEAEDQAELDVGDQSGESVTVEAWVDIRSSGDFPGDWQYIVNKPNSYSLYVERYYNWGALRYVGCVGVFITVPSGQLKGFEHCRVPAYALGWHHVAFVFNQETGDIRLYLDGEAFGDPYSIGPDINNSDDNLKVGRNLDGSVDELRISDVARYSGSTYAVPTSPFACDAHTRALWHFDELEGTTQFHDRCGADNLLTGYNGAHTEGVTVRRVYLPYVELTR